MRLRPVIAALPILALALVACGSSGSDSSTTTGTATSGSGTAASGATSEAAMVGPEVPAATVVADPVAKTDMPTASGGFGDKPTLTFPKSDPPNSLQRQVLIKGDGAKVGSTDWVIAHYLGQVWGGKVFDNSYDRKDTSAFQLDNVVPGWKVGLTGMTEGSRVLLSLPPSDGYGMNGNSGAGISGTDTIVFVIDIVKAIGPSQGGQTDAKVHAQTADQPKVTGALGKAPTITIGSAKQPTKNSTFVLATGTGDKLTDAGKALVQYEAIGWDGKSLGSTWPDSKSAAQTGSGGTGPTEIPLSKDNVFAGLSGQPIGSRVLIELAPSTDSTSGSTNPAAAVVVDILYQTSKTAS
jgi:peptidylprolyl isomerase